MTIYNRLNEHKIWYISQNELNLLLTDYRSPWLVCPPEIALTIWKMQSGGPKLGDNPGVSMGVKTSANFCNHILQI